MKGSYLRGEVFDGGVAASVKSLKFDDPGPDLHQVPPRSLIEVKCRPVVGIPLARNRSRLGTVAHLEDSRCSVGEYRQLLRRVRRVRRVHVALARGFAVAGCVGAECFGVAACGGEVGSGALQRDLR